MAFSVNYLFLPVFFNLGVSSSYEVGIKAKRQPTGAVSKRGTRRYLNKLNLIFAVV